MKPNDRLGNSPSEFLATLDPQNTTEEQVPIFDLELDDEQLVRICANQLQADIDYWEKAPFLLTRTDKENIAYLLGDQKDGKVGNPNTETPYVDNRLFSSVRAILAYATGQPAKPELLPSKTDDKYKHIARQTEAGLYQHVLDHDVNSYMRLATKNLLHRKRGYLKLRYDDDYGAFGDICTENIDPSDVVIARSARFRNNPERIYHRQKKTIQHLVEHYPDKKDEIYSHYGIRRGVASQTSRLITYWECWFTYFDQNNEEAEGVCWFIPNSTIVLGKMKNPNWIYKGSTKNQKIINMTSRPPKPFITLNYWNSGRSYIDETCLFDQARPLQDILNKRGRQIVENADYANPRLLANGTLWDEGDAKKFINKSAKTIGLLNQMSPEANINDAVKVIEPSNLPSYVLEDKFDARSEIDNMMGTPVQFQGQPSRSKNPTLGQDMLVKNQASALQDDLVVAINQAWRDYYILLIQMMNTYLPDDYYVMVRGKDGEYTHIMLNQDSLDTNVRVTVTVDSTLPLDKMSQRATAIQLAQINRIDDLSLFELLGMPDPEKLAERKLRWEIDRYTYMQSVEQKLMSNEAEADIQLLVANKEPEERDDYNEDYLNHFNLFITTNRFMRLPLDVKQRLVAYLHKVADKAALTEGLRDSMLNPAGIIDRPPIFPLPKREIQYRMIGQMGPQDTANIAGGESALAVPVTQAQQAQNQAAGGANPQPGQGSPPAPKGQPSPPRMQNPSQF